MRLSILILLLGCYFKVHGQDYIDAGVIFEMIGEHAEMSEFFEDRDSPFRIDQYKYNEKIDSLEFVGGCSFMYLSTEIIQSCVYKRKARACKKRYWTWTKNEDDDKFGYIEECNKKGVLKSPNLDFKTTEYTITDTDSIVDQKSWWVGNKGDTSCHFNDRWIYRNDTLMEYWHDDFFGKCSWENSERFSITKYSYPTQNTTIIETFSGTAKNNKSLGKRKVVKSYNQMGQVTSIITSWIDRSNNQRVFEDRYFYDDGKWIMTERWYDGELTEQIIKTTANKTYKQ